MTTIAYRDGVLAADRRSGNDWIQGEVTKIHRVHAWLFAGSGNYGEVETLRRAVESAGRDFLDALSAAKIEESVAVLINRHEIYEIQKGGWFRYPPDSFHAWGSGYPAALAAMHAGADAQRAVEIACLIDNDSGNGVDVLRLAEGGE